ncbi:MAG: hypothetical protein O7D94_05325, partial [Planctomycetota bacterium]|nr:hypothetical protein [Planctomycetota bacterium]
MMRQLQRSVLALIATALPVFFISAAGVSGQQPSAPPDLDPLEPLLPPGISDFDIELYSTYAYVWKSGE